MAPDGSIRPRIGICLSGGGFRATLFGLGVVRYLVEAGYARDIQALSAVFGGSVAAAVLAEGWPRVLASPSTDAVAEIVAAPLIEVISTKNLRNRGWPGSSAPACGPGVGTARRADARSASHLLDTRWLAELPHDLQVVITSTDLTTGRAFRMSQQFIGSWDHGYAPTPPRLSTATALAASTAVPRIFRRCTSKPTGST